MISVVPVHVWLPGNANPVLAGEFSHDSTAMTGQFQYTQGYIDARYPALAPDIPLRTKPIRIVGGLAIFPLFLDAGPDRWGRHLLSKRLERDVDEIEALKLCPADGVGNIALGELTAERMRILSIEEFLAILSELERGGAARSDIEEQVLDAAQNGTSLGGTKPKLTISREGVQYLAKFPEPGDSRWLPHIESAMLKIAHQCGIRACQAEVWRLTHDKAALLVRRFDRASSAGGVARVGYVSAHALLRLDQMPQQPADTLQYGTVGFTASGLRKSYVALASDMARWCGGQDIHREERRELWRRIAFNALIRNIDDHPKNHGMLCENMARQKWRLSPAFDLVPAAATAQQPALSMAYRYVPPTRRGRQETAPRLVTRIAIEDLLAAAAEHYGYTDPEAQAWLRHAAQTVAATWRDTMAAEGMPADEIQRFEKTFQFAKDAGGA